MSADALLAAVRGQSVSREHAADLLRAFAKGEAAPELLASLLTALAIRGETAGALLGFAEVLREHMIPVELGEIPAVDLCGTGGDGQHTVNLSTAAAFVTAAAGVPVAKHGNHGVSSRTGSADVLSALGVPRLEDPRQLARRIQKCGLGFIYAPAHHPLFAKIAPLRRNLGFRTAFNLLGPLCNPARVQRQVIGVPSLDALKVVAEVLSELGTARSMVVHTPGPYDEVSLTEPAIALLVEGKHIQTLHLPPSAFGAEPVLPKDLVGQDALANARQIQRVFEGPSGSGDPKNPLNIPLQRAICANAACALFVSGAARDVREGFSMAMEAVETGRALAKLNESRILDPDLDSEEKDNVLAH